MARVPLPTVTLAVLLTALVALPRAQSGAARHVEGRVVADDTGDPIPHAKVGFTTSGTARATLTDQEGRFAIETVPGVARLAVTKAGYARREIALQPARGVDVRLTRTAVITGRVSYADGEPAVNVAVSAGVPVPGSQAFLVRATSATDDRGEFRLFGLSEERLVVATYEMDRNANLYFPGVESISDAELLDVKAGDEIDRIDLSLGGASDHTPTMAVGNGTVFITTSPLRPPGPDEQVAVVRGRVVSATGGVVAGAQVRLTQNAGGAAAVTRSGRDGRFTFTIVPGPFLIAASKAGYSSSGSPFGRAITVTATGAEAELTLTPWSTVTGRVVDESGEPVQGARLQLLRPQFQGGRRRLVSAATRTSDDRGVFRMFGVEPGQYILSASAGDVSTAELPGYVRTFFPGVTDAEFSPFITVGAGQVQSGADITLVRQRTARVSGIVRDAQGRPGLVGSLNLIPSQSSSSLTTAVGARVGEGGAFEFPNVPPGRYVIQVYRGARNRSTEGEFGAVTVSVAERDVEGLTVQATAGSTITGRLSFVAATPGATPPRAGIDIEAVPSERDLAPLNGWATADIRPDWTFVLSGISGPRRLEVTRTPPGWAVDQIRVRGIDVTDQPLAFGTAAQSTDDVEVVLTDRVTQILGRVRDRDGRAAVGATAIVFAPTRDRWYAESRYMRAAPVGEDGRFRVEGLPSGHYYVAAVANVPAGGAGAWRDPAFLESLVAPSTSVSVGDGGRAEVALSVVEPR